VCVCVCVCLCLHVTTGGGLVISSSLHNARGVGLDRWMPPCLIYPHAKIENEMATQTDDARHHPTPSTVQGLGQMNRELTKIIRKSRNSLSENSGVVGEHGQLSRSSNRVSPETDYV